MTSLKLPANALLSFAGLIFAILLTVAVQAQVETLKPGDSVEVRLSSTYGWETCSVAENPPGGLLRVRCAQRDGRPAGVFVVYDKRDVRVAAKTVDSPAGPKNGGNTVPTKSAPSGAGGYEVGSPVEASPTFNESKWRPCRIAEISTGNGLKVWCEDFGGQPSGTYSVTTRWVRPRTFATAADTGGSDCNYDPPPGFMTGSTASEQLFKRVIYNHYNEETVRATPRPLKVGIMFETFQMGTPFTNSFGGRRFKHDRAPENARLYPVKTRFTWCREYTSSVYRYVMESNFVCFKDRMGNWDCPVDGVPKFIEQRDYPILRR